MYRNLFILVGAVSLLAFVLGLAYGTTFNGGCSELKDAPFGCAEYLFSRYQTLIAMFGAIFIGVYAVRPVLKQLRLMSLQTTITLHQTYGAREKVLGARAKAELAKLNELSSELDQGYLRLEQDDPNISHWVWDMQQEVDRVAARLQRRQTENIDGDETTISRQSLINQMKQLSECMSDYNGTVYLDNLEYEISDEDRARVEAAEALATKNLPARIAAVTNAIVSLNESFEADLAEVRLKRQLIDQILINAELPT